MPVAQRESRGVAGAQEEAFGVQIRVYPIGRQEKQCFILPVVQSQYHGISKMKGLTGKCVCLGCVAGVIEGAEKVNKDIGEAIMEQLTTPVNIQMARMTTPGWPGNNVNPLNSMADMAERVDLPE